NSFQPSTLTVSAGTTVTWSWAASAQDHNVRPVGTEPSRSGNPRDGPATYQFTFNTPGTYTYYCEVHGSPTFGRRGTIVDQ
ncbi:MAG TPA: plastocyanin/azurin family copper-binding protein, partial [Gemmatimonadales bacterium]|nr:plastocyanin/azurin family copper-binding protein [Gemmatimonadales bacterium]